MSSEDAVTASDQDDSVVIDVDGPEFVADSTMSPVAGRIYELLAPIVATADVELLDVEWTGGTLQVIVDHEDGVNIDSLATVNRLVSPILDQHDPISGRYTLEVSSPGVERPLRRSAHYQRAIGEVVIVKTEPHVEPRRVKGTLIEASDSELSIDVTEVDGVDLPEVDRRAVAIVDIASARTIFEWGPTPKKGGKANQPKQQKKPQKKSHKNSEHKTGDKSNKQKAAGDSAADAAGNKAGAKDDAGNDNKIEQDRKKVDDE